MAIRRSLLLATLAKLGYSSPVARTLVGLRARTVIVRSPAMARSLLGLEREALVKDESLKALKSLLNDGLLTTNGDFHEAHRAVVAKVLRRGEVDQAGHTLRLIAREVLDEQSGGELNITSLVHKIALRQTTVVLFGTRLPVELEEATLRAIAGASGNVEVQLKYGGQISSLVNRGKKTLEKAELVFTELIQFLDDHAEDSLLMKALDALRDPGLTDRDARVDNIRTMIVAGHETTANAILWALILMRGRPGPGSVHDASSSSCTDVEEELRAILAESMRLYPTGWMVSRTVIDSGPLSDLAVELRRRDRVLVSAWLFHRDPAVWDAPDEFRPERWLDPEGAFSRAAVGEARSYYIPFGLGRRVCVGEYFAWAAALAALKELWEDDRLTLTQGQRFTAVAGVTLRPTPHVRGRVRGS